MTRTLSGEKILPRPVLDDISIIIPTLGRDLLEDCLLSIAEGSAWPNQLIVVDQSSSPKVARWIRILSEYGIQAVYLPSSKRGVAAGRNEGISHASTRFIALTDDDMKIDLNWLWNLYDYLQENPNEIVTGRVEPGGEGTAVSVKTSIHPKKYSQPQLKEDILYPGNMGCAKELFSVVGLFDESEYLRFAEDNDWSYRALRSRVTIAYVPEVVVIHQDWRNHEQLAATYRNSAFSQGGFYGKHLRNGDWFIALRIVFGIIRSVRRLLVGIITNNQGLRFSGLTVILNLISGIKAGYIRSREIT